MKLEEKVLVRIEDYIQALDENVGLKIETIKDVAQAITKHRGLVKKLTKPVVKSLKIENKMNFGNWKFTQGLRYVSDHTYKNASNELFDVDVVNKNYDDYINL
jgi:hypothetical protein